MLARAAVHDSLNTLADPTRGRILHVLERNELTVGELCAVLQMPQSTVSRHLRLLSDEGWVASRQEGTSRYYSLGGELAPGAQRLWGVVSEALAASEVARHDRARMKSVLARRREKSREFFSTSAAAWDSMRAQLFGDRADLMAMSALLDDAWTVGDLGCGTGRLVEFLAPNVQQVIGVDASEAMLEAARQRLTGVPNVDLRAGDLEALPIADGTLDAALVMFVLHYVAEPSRLLSEARRALRPGGRLLVVDMLPHDRVEYRQQMGHVWLGFSERQMRVWLGEAGFDRVRYRALPAEADAKGPMLFVATGRNTEARGQRLEARG